MELERELAAAVDLHAKLAVDGAQVGPQGVMTGDERPQRLDQRLVIELAAGADLHGQGELRRTGPEALDQPEALLAEGGLRSRGVRLSGDRRQGPDRRLGATPGDRVGQGLEARGLDQRPRADRAVELLAEDRSHLDRRERVTPQPHEGIAGGDRAQPEAAGHDLREPSDERI